MTSKRIISTIWILLLSALPVSGNISTLTGLLPGPNLNNNPNNGPVGENQSFMDNGAIYGFDANEFGSSRFWDGFSTSSETATAFGSDTVGFANEMKAITGSGNGDDVYGIYFNSEEGITFSAGSATVQSIDITNTTYVYYALLFGADGWNDMEEVPTNSFVTKYADGTYLDEYDNSLTPFGVGDFFEVTATGYLGGSPVDTSTVRLAEWNVSSGSFEIEEEWNTWTLNFSEIDTLEFSIAGTDTGDFGLNTPAYFAFDNLTFTPVPEPAFAGFIFAFGAFALVCGFRRRPRESRC
ncbi:MAG: DUF4465 domain-containing protein [Verrucomicrobiota bacterium]